MKDKMDIMKFKNLDSASIEAKIIDLKKALMEARFALASGQLADISKLSQMKKAIAQLNTFLTIKK